MSLNIFGNEMTALPPDAQRCPAERWHEDLSRFLRCEYTKDHPGDHARATVLWGVIWPAEEQR